MEIFFLFTLTSGDGLGGRIPMWMRSPVVRSSLVNLAALVAVTDVDPALPASSLTGRTSSVATLPVLQDPAAN